MRGSLVIWLACSVAGGAIVALPDTGPRLVSFSQAHGPSALDGLGILVLLAGWLAPAVAVWRRRGRLAGQAGTPAFGLVLFALGLGAGLTVASVGADYPHWWVVGAALLVVAQLVAARLASRGRIPAVPE